MKRNTKQHNFLKKEFGKKRNRIYKSVFIVMTALTVLIIAFAFPSLSAKANSTEGADDYKYYTSHMIMPKESLWSIAEENIDYVHYDSIQDYMNEVKFINGIDNSELQIGDYILIPYFSEELK